MIRLLILLLIALPIAAIIVFAIVLYCGAFIISG